MKKLESYLVLAIIITLLLSCVIPACCFICFAIAITAVIMDVLPDKLFQKDPEMLASRRWGTWTVKKTPEK
ncbi:MAG: hypothetical protein IKE31_08310 [Eubacterium sp.]|nr:hypothetical protein [Eubacterium sp.]